MRIQLNQQTFGTKVLARPAAKEIIETSKAKDTMLKQIEQLKNNGVDDFLILNCDGIKDTGKVYINAEIVEFIKNDCYINSFSPSDYLEKEQNNEQSRFLDINNLYLKAKEKMVQANLATKNLFDTLIHEYQEM